MSRLKKEGIHNQKIKMKEYKPGFRERYMNMYDNSKTDRSDKEKEINLKEFHEQLKEGKRTWRFLDLFKIPTKKNG